MLTQKDDAPLGHVKKRTIGLPTFIVSLAIMGAVGFIAGTRNDFLVSYFTGVKSTNDTINLASVQAVYQRLKANFNGSLDNEKLIDGASRGLVAAADDQYTVFMDRAEAAEFNKELSGEITGIGAEIGVRTSQPTIIRILADSPAEKAGVKAGDTIKAVNGEAVDQSSADKVASKIRGESGTSVKITVSRGGNNLDFTITRAKLNNPSVRWSVNDGVGTLTIVRFDSDTADLAGRAAQQFKDQGVSGVVLDLRDNGGGYADAGRDVAGLWVANKTIFTANHSDGSTDTQKSGASAPLQGIKTIVLVNGGTASASEIVTAALQEYGAATIVGEKTFGKGSEQQLIQLADGRMLKVTIAKWYTPNGKNISKDGITPDKTVPMTAADVDASKDPQMEAALAALKQ